MRTKDFSCLGMKQKYLRISYSEHLNNSDLYRLMNIPYLQLFHCSKITDISMLSKNRFLMIGFCKGLKEATMEGIGYRLVELRNPNLEKVIVMGRIDQLIVFKHSQVIHPENVMSIESERM